MLRRFSVRKSSKMPATDVERDLIRKAHQDLTQYKSETEAKLAALETKFVEQETKSAEQETKLAQQDMEMAEQKTKIGALESEVKELSATVAKMKIGGEELEKKVVDVGGKMDKVQKGVNKVKAQLGIEQLKQEFNTKLQAMEAAHAAQAKANEAKTDNNLLGSIAELVPGGKIVKNVANVLTK